MKINTIYTLHNSYMPPNQIRVRKQNRNEKYICIKKKSPLLITVLVTILFILTNLQYVKGQTNEKYFSFNPISKVEFRNAFKTNYNAPIVTSVSDSTKLEKAFKAIEKTYDENEKQLALHELCDSPRCLTSFEAFYPTLNLYLFHIQDYHYEKAVFVFADTNELASHYARFRGSYGVMSKDGLWVGLQRDGSDNYLQLEICKSSEHGIWSLFKFDFAATDINLDYGDKSIPIIFWADKNTIYISTQEYDQENNRELLKYYSIKFDY